MSTLGFEVLGDGAYSNREIIVKDIRPRNVMVDAEGDIYVVDAEFEKYGNTTRFRVVTDKTTLDRLNSVPTINVYRTMYITKTSFAPKR